MGRSPADFELSAGFSVLFSKSRILIYLQAHRPNLQRVGDLDR